MVYFRTLIFKLKKQTIQFPVPVQTNNMEDEILRFLTLVYKYFKEIFDNLLRILISIADGFGNKAMAKFYSMSMAQEVSQYLFF